MLPIVQWQYVHFFKVALSYSLSHTHSHNYTYTHIHSKWCLAGQQAPLLMLRTNYALITSITVPLTDINHHSSLTQTHWTERKMNRCIQRHMHAHWPGKGSRQQAEQRAPAHLSSPGQNLLSSVLMGHSLWTITIQKLAINLQNVSRHQKVLKQMCLLPHRRILNHVPVLKKWFHKVYFSCESIKCTKY